MTGTLRRRGRRSWEIRFDIGRDPATGARRFHYASVRGTRRDAERALAEAVHEQRAGTAVSPSTLSVAAFLERWLTDYAAGQVAPSTFARYRGITNRLLPLLGAHRLQALQPAHVQAAYARLSDEGLAARTVQHHHRMLKQALQHAVRWRLLAHNPAEAVSPPRPELREMRALTPAEVQRLLDACGDAELRTIIRTAVTTGLRLGELLGLRWQDLDLNDGTATIARAAQYLHGRVSLRPPKTAKARRTIALSDETVRDLRAHRARQLAHRLRLGAGYHDGDFVFPAEDGDLQAPYRVSQAFRRLVDQTDLGHVRFHDLRHTAATLMLRAGVPTKIVSTRLGHATASLTLDTYSHVTVDMQREAVNAIDAVLEAR